VATERGTVIEVGDGTAWIKTERSGACESCSSKGSCFAMHDGDDMKVHAVNIVGANVGDRVVINLESVSLFKVTFFLYMFPVLSLIGGVIIGFLLAPSFNTDDQMLAAILGFACFIGSVLIIKTRGRRMSEKDEYKPKIIRIVRNQ
jgi:sigma-E factor negative regulatory protein RseC